MISPENSVVLGILMPNWGDGEGGVVVLGWWSGLSGNQLFCQIEHRPPRRFLMASSPSVTSVTHSGRWCQKQWFAACAPSTPCWIVLRNTATASRRVSAKNCACGLSCRLRVACWACDPETGRSSKRNCRRTLGIAARAWGLNFWYVWILNNPCSSSFHLWAVLYFWWLWGDVMRASGENYIFAYWGDFTLFFFSLNTLC